MLMLHAIRKHDVEMGVAYTASFLCHAAAASVCEAAYIPDKRSGYNVQFVFRAVHVNIAVWIVAKPVTSNEDFIMLLFHISFKFLVKHCTWQTITHLPSMETNTTLCSSSQDRLKARQ